MSSPAPAASLLAGGAFRVLRPRISPSFWLHLIGTQFHDFGRDNNLLGFKKQIWKKGIKFRDSHALRFILFVKNSEPFKISITKRNSTKREKKKTLHYLKGHTLMKNNKLNFIYILHYMLYRYKPEPLPQMRTFFFFLFLDFTVHTVNTKTVLWRIFSGSPDNLRKKNEVVGNWNFLE